MLNKYPLANCDYVGKIEQMLHYEDLINARYENVFTKLQHCVVAVSSKSSRKVNSGKLSITPSNKLVLERLNKCCKTKN